MVAFFFPMQLGSLGPQTADYIEHDVLSIAGSQATGTVNIGAAAPRRRVVLGLNWSELSVHRTPSSATIGGIAATIHIQRGHNGGTTGLGSAIISAVVPTGTTAAVVINFSGSSLSSVGVGVWRLNRYDTIVATGSDETTVTTGALSVNVSTAANGFVIGVYTGSTNTQGFNVSWTNVTEQYETSPNSEDSGAHAAVSAGSLTVGATQGVISNSGNDLVVVSWAT
jgi:hypothetical protein